MKALIAVPCLSGLVQADTARSLFSLRRPPNSAIQFAVGSIVTTARNELVRSARSNGFTHILFIDDDMVFPNDTLERLAAHGKPIVGAYGVKKRHPIQRCGEPLEKWAESGLCEMRSLGMAICLINTKVFERVESPWFDWSRAPDGRDISEDTFFCYKARAAGLKIYADCDLSREIGHVGSFVYRDV